MLEICEDIYLGSAKPEGGGSATLITKTITENNTYNASSDGADGYSTVIVNVPSSGTQIVVPNNSNSALTTGDKVFLMPKATTQSRVQITTSSSYCCVVNTMGTKVFYYNKVHDILSGQEETKSLTLADRLFGVLGGVQYDAYGNVFVGYIKLDSTMTEMSYSLIQDEFAVQKLTDDYSHFGVELYKFDSSYQAVKTWTVSTGVNGRSRFCKVGDRIYFRAYTGDYSYALWYWVIDETTDSISWTNTGENLFCFYSTKDNKIAICGTALNYPYSSGVKLYNINNDYSIGTEFVSANLALNSLLSETNVYLVFNRQTGVLTVASASSDTNYGMFKYENGDFTTIPLNLSDFTATDKKMMTTPMQPLNLQIGMYYYTLAQTGEGYQAVSYSNFNENGYTGTAAENGAIGEGVTVNTVM